MNCSRREQYEISDHTHQGQGTLKIGTTMSHNFQRGASKGARTYVSLSPQSLKTFKESFPSMKTSKASRMLKLSRTESDPSLLLPPPLKISPGTDFCTDAKRVQASNVACPTKLALLNENTPRQGIEAHKDISGFPSGTTKPREPLLIRAPFLPEYFGNHLPLGDIQVLQVFTSIVHRRGGIKSYRRHDRVEESNSREVAHSWVEQEG